jgi:hypothetical protein
MTNSKENLQPQSFDYKAFMAFWLKKTQQKQ